MFHLKRFQDPWNASGAIAQIFLFCYEEVSMIIVFNFQWFHLHPWLHFKTEQLVVGNVAHIYYELRYICFMYLKNDKTKTTIGKQIMSTKQVADSNFV